MAQRKSIDFCECGCGGLTNPGKRWRRGHSVRVNHPTRGKGHPRMLDGYIFLPIQKDHPFFSMAIQIGGSWFIAEHRLVMAEAIGRPLKGGNDCEIVHHMLECEGGTGDQMDNRIENLMLFPDQATHRRHHSALFVAARTHCVNGHTWTPGRRNCLTCARDSMRRARARKRAS